MATIAQVGATSRHAQHLPGHLFSFWRRFEVISEKLVFKDLLELVFAESRKMKSLLERESSRETWIASLNQLVHRVRIPNQYHSLAPVRIGLNVGDQSIDDGDAV